MGLYSLFHPEIFQGRHKKSHYFEGWYFKMALQGRQPEVLSIIPGVALGASEEERHAFIQVISSREGRSWNIHFPFESFKADEKKLFVEIAGNRFSTEEIILNINHEGLL